MEFKTVGCLASSVIASMNNLTSDKNSGSQFIDSIKSIINSSNTLLDRNEVLEKVDYFQSVRYQRPDLVASAALASFPYHQDLNVIGEHAVGWAPNGDLAKKMADSDANLQFIKDKNIIVDNNTGLVASVFHCKATNEVRLIFGGSTSGKVGGDLVTRSLHNAGNTATHWGANIGNAVLGKIPKSYQQAVRLTELLSNMSKFDTTVWGRFTVSTSGHSKGAGEAAYLD